MSCSPLWKEPVIHFLFDASYRYFTYAEYEAIVRAATEKEQAEKNALDDEL